MINDLSKKKKITIKSLVRTNKENDKIIKDLLDEVTLLTGYIASNCDHELWNKFKSQRLNVFK